MIFGIGSFLLPTAVLTELDIRVDKAGNKNWLVMSWSSITEIIVKDAGAYEASLYTLIIHQLFLKKSEKIRVWGNNKTR